MDKKAMELSDTLVWIIVFFGLIFLFVVFFFMFKLIGDSIQSELAAQTTSSVVGLTLQNYMRSPIIIDGKTMTVAEAVSLAEKNESVQEKLKEYTTEFFDDKFVDGWQLKFYYPDELEYGHSYDGQVAVGAIKTLPFFALQGTMMGVAIASTDAGHTRIEGYIPSKENKLIRYRFDYWVIIWSV